MESPATDPRPIPAGSNAFAPVLSIQRKVVVAKQPLEGDIVSGLLAGDRALKHPVPGQPMEEGIRRKRLGPEITGQEQRD